MSTCICGKPASNFCSRCLTSRYCSRECLARDWEKHKQTCKPKYNFEILQKHIRENWSKVLRDIILLKEKDESDFLTGYVISKPDSPLPHLTCAFTVLKEYPRTVFLLWSSSRDGVYLQKTKDGFFCTAKNIVYSEDKCPEDLEYFCAPFGSQQYAFVDWAKGIGFGGGSIDDFVKTISKT